MKAFKGNQGLTRKAPIVLFCIILFSILLNPFKTFAGWPIGKHKVLVIPSFTYYSQKDRFDNNGNKIKGAPGTGYSSYSASLYFGYGLGRKLDLIASVPLLYQQNKYTSTNEYTNHGFGDMLVGVSYNLVDFNYLRFLSVQVSGLIPLYSNNTAGTSNLGLGDFGNEIKLMFCGSLPKSIASKGYFNTEIAYRRYYNAQGPDQISFLATIGYPVSKHNQMSLDILLFRSFSSDKNFNPNFFAERNYAFFKPSLNFGHQFTRSFSIFLGGYYVPIGLNTGVGYGGSVQSILRF